VPALRGAARRLLPGQVGGQCPGVAVLASGRRTPPDVVAEPAAVTGGCGAEPPSRQG